MEYKKGFYKLGDKVEFQDNIYVLKATSLYSQSLIQEANDGYWVNITSPSTGGGGGLPNPLVLVGDPNATIQTQNQQAMLSLNDATGNFTLSSTAGATVGIGTISTGDPVGGQSASLVLDPSTNSITLANGFNTARVTINGNSIITSSDILNVNIDGNNFIEWQAASLQISVAPLMIIGGGLGGETLSITMENLDIQSVAFSLFSGTPKALFTIPGPEWTSFETAYPTIANMLSANLGYKLVSNNS